MEKKLYRDETRKVIGGVCAGLADYFGVDVAIVRLLFLLTLILKGGGMLIYIVLWIVLPKKGYQINQPFVDYTVPPPVPPQAPPPIFNQPQKRSTASIIAGTILVLLGVYFIMDDFNIIPDWDFDHFWPVILIAIGVIFIFSGEKKQPWEKENWHQNDNSSNDSPSNDSSSNDSPSNDNSSNNNSTTL